MKKDQILHQDKASYSGDKEKPSKAQASGGASDWDLVTQAKDGNEEAFKELFQRYYMTVYQLTFRLCSNKEDAEETTQDTFVKAARGIKNFRGDANIRSWLWRIAVNCSNDKRRKRKSRSDTLENYKRDYDVLTEDATFAPSAGTSEEKNVSPEILAALDKLPSKQREVIVLTLIEDLSHKEVAEILNVSINTVSWRAFSAKGKLKKLLRNFSS